MRYECNLHINFATCIGSLPMPQLVTGGKLQEPREFSCLIVGDKIVTRFLQGIY